MKTTSFGSGNRYINTKMDAWQPSLQSDGNTALGDIRKPVECKQNQHSAQKAWIKPTFCLLDLAS